MLNEPSNGEVLQGEIIHPMSQTLAYSSSTEIVIDSTTIYPVIDEDPVEIVNK